MRAADVYRALLWCYPAPFREEYGAQMVSAFTDQLRDSRAHARPLAAAAVWAGTLADLLPTAFKEHCHVIRQDLRHAIRLLATSPGFTAVAVLSLALGIGANTAIFSLLDSVVMSTLPVPQPHELVMLTDPGTSGVSVGMEGGDRSLVTYTEFRQLQARTTTFASLTAVQSSLQRSTARVDGGAPEEIAVRMVSASYFATLGVPAVLGRTFDAGPEPARGAAPWAVISYPFWQRRLGGRPDAVGRTIAIKTGVFTIIGVAPASFFGETVGERPDAWVPLAMQAILVPGRAWLEDAPGNVEKVMWLHLFGRLRPGVTIARAQADANVVFAQGLQAYYGSIADEKTRKRFMEQKLVVRNAATGASSIRDEFAEPLFVLFAAAGLVLLIACANLGNLMLARTTARSREMAVRLALGASRGRVVRQFLTESLVLAVLGGLVGVAASVALRAGLLRLVSDANLALPAGFDLRLVLFVIALTLATGLVLGLLPALRITRTEAATGLREQGRGIAGSAAWLRIGKAVVIGQLALSLPLLAGAGLLGRTLANLQCVDLGYAKDDVVTVRIDAKAAGYDFPRQAAAFDAVLAQVRAVPGVTAATYSNNGLFGGSDNGDQIDVEGYKPTGQDDTGSRYDAVGPGYFSTLGIPVLLGREITDQDRVAGHPVCVINQAFARRFFKGRSPLGLHVTQHYADEQHACEVVGVVADSRQNRLRTPIEHRFYAPATQPVSSIDSVTYIVRARGEPTRVVADVRRTIERAEPAMPTSRAGTLTEAVNQRIVQDRLLAQLSIAFSVVAALLVAMGLYGVLSYGVARRTNEIGVRKALGATHAALVGMILRETGVLVALGLVAGGALAAGAVRLITSRLYGLSPGDPLTFTLAIVGLVFVAMLAAWRPASRAARVDPLVALRYE